jgi:hypothetical protein
MPLLGLIGALDDWTPARCVARANLPANRLMTLQARVQAFLHRYLH